MKTVIKYRFFFFSKDDAIIKILRYKTRMSNLVAFSERQSEYCEMLQASFRPNQALQWRTELQENHRLLRELERFLAQQLFHKDFLQSLLPAAAVRHQKKQKHLSKLHVTKKERRQQNQLDLIIS